MASAKNQDFSVVHDCGERRLEIAAIVRAAFEQRYGSGEGEVAIIARLRKARAVVAELTAIGGGGDLLGYAMFSRMTARPSSRRVAALGPVCARQDRRRCGIGSALIRTGLEACAAKGFGAVFVLGEPSYYGRFGFRAETAAPIECSYAGPHFQAVELCAGALAGVKSVAYAPAFAAV